MELYVLIENNESKNIKHLKIGDKVLSFTINNLENNHFPENLEKDKIDLFDGNFSYEKVKNVWKSRSNIIYNINNEVILKSGQYIFCKRDILYFWIKVEDLTENDFLFKSDNSFQKINSIKLMNPPPTQMGRGRGGQRGSNLGKNIFNLSVNKVYNYFLNGYLVHNAGVCTACRRCGGR